MKMILLVIMVALLGLICVYIVVRNTFPNYRLLYNSETHKYRVEQKIGVAGFNPLYNTCSEFNDIDEAKAAYNKLVKEQEIRNKIKSSWKRVQ
jgi:hypothetical protein